GSHAGKSECPADMYLEGSDQHRGWFHSSLLTSSMLNGCPPYRALLTHGFGGAGDGRKMSKSLGNGMEPHEIDSELGASLRRLWVASPDCSGGVALTPAILRRVAESYRRIRNTLRFLPANVSAFDIESGLLPVDELLEIGRYAIAMTEAWQRACTEDMARF